jgi:hypothetical protein
MATGDYWSSAQGTLYNAQGHYFSDDGAQMNYGKDYTGSVRAIRAF